MTNDTPITWEIPTVWGALCQKPGKNAKYIYYATSKLKDAGGGEMKERKEWKTERDYVEKRITTLLTKTNKWTNKQQQKKTTGQFQITGDKEHPLSYQKGKLGFKLA